MSWFQIFCGQSASKRILAVLHDFEVYFSIQFFFSVFGKIHKNCENSSLFSAYFPLLIFICSGIQTLNIFYNPLVMRSFYFLDVRTRRSSVAFEFWILCSSANGGNMAGCNVPPTPVCKLSVKSCIYLRECGPITENGIYKIKCRLPSGISNSHVYHNRICCDHKCPPGQETTDPHYG